MNDIRWFNPGQPQTLQGAVALAYLNAVFALLSVGFLADASRIPTGLIVIAIAAQIAGAVGIASEKKAGYMLGVGAASFLALTRLLVVLRVGFSQSFISFMFSAALVGLLVHDQSRNYQRVWFR